MKVFITFLLINFGALALGSYLMGGGSSSEWYQSLNKAPWTPPGWVFGAAWTTIMICFSIFMYYVYNASTNKTAILYLFSLQFLLNVGWNPVFFYYHNMLAGLFIISALTILTVILLVTQFSSIKFKVVFILPYVVWLFIATSLNAYAWLKN